MSRLICMKRYSEALLVENKAIPDSILTDFNSCLLVATCRVLIIFANTGGPYLDLNCLTL